MSYQGEHEYCNITIRLWLTDPEPNENEAIAAKRKLLRPKLDDQTGSYFIEVEGHDGFEIAKLVPQPLVRLITVRQQINFDPMYRVMEIHVGPTRA